MAGLDPELNRQLMATLRRCDAFSSNAELRNVFAMDTRLSPWAYNVPEAGNPSSRVQAIIAFLHEKANIQGENALVLFLQVLQNLYAPSDAYFRELGALIVNLGGVSAAPAMPVSPSKPLRSTGSSIDYDVGVRTLLARLGAAHPNYRDALVYQQRLNDNQGSARLFGDTETRRAERAEIIMQLNSLALTTLNVTFNELSGMSPVASDQSLASLPTTGNITIVGDGNVIGSNNQVSVKESEMSSSGGSNALLNVSGLPDRTFQMKLLKILTQYFSLNDVQTLCFALGINYDDLPSGGLTGKARELIGYCERHLCLPKLIAAGKTLRPELDWS